MRYKPLIISLLLSGCATTQSVSSYQVTGVGRTFEEAKQNAFTKAIENKLGVLVISEREQQNLRLVKDEILTYSGGYVNKYHITNTTNIGNTYSLTMDVDVSESKIRDRVLGAGTSISEIQGNNHKTQYSTYLHDRDKGDQIYQKVLQDYPKYAYTIEQKPHLFKLDQYRNAVLIVPYTMRWNYNYLQALNELLGKLEDGSNGFRQFNPGTITIMAKNPNDFAIGQKNVYRFNDVKRVTDLNDRLTGYNEVRIQVNLRDSNNKIIYNSCIESNSVNGKKPSFYAVGNNFTIFGNQTDKDEIRINVNTKSVLYNNLQNLHRVELIPTTIQNCINKNL